MNTEFTMKRVCLQTSLACNLNCRLCGAYAPYAKDKGVPTIAQMVEWTSNYFDLVDFVELFAITGGEPLLYKKLPEYFGSLSQFKEKIGHIEIYTNGSIVPSPDLIKAIKGSRQEVIFKVDNYGSDLSDKISEISSVLDGEGIKYSVRDYYSDSMHCGGWVDYGDPVKIIHSPKEAEDIFKKCIQPNILKYCFTIFKNLLFPCSQVYRRIDLGQAVDYNDYIDFTDPELSIEQQRQKIQSMYTRCLETCAYCKGMCDDSPRFKPAEQLSKEEIYQIKNSMGDSLK